MYRNTYVQEYLYQDSEWRETFSRRRSSCGLNFQCKIPCILFSTFGKNLHPRPSNLKASIQGSSCLRPEGYCAEMSSGSKHFLAVAHRVVRNFQHKILLDLRSVSFLEYFLPTVVQPKAFTLKETHACVLGLLVTKVQVDLDMFSSPLPLEWSQTLTQNFKFLLCS